MIEQHNYNISGRALEDYRTLALRNQPMITIYNLSSFRPND